MFANSIASGAGHFLRHRVVVAVPSDSDGFVAHFRTQLSPCDGRVLKEKYAGLIFANWLTDCSRSPAGLTADDVVEHEVVSDWTI